MSTDLPESSDAESTPFTEEDGVLYEEDVTPQPGTLGFTRRELLIVGVWLVAFVVSFFPFSSGESIWATGIQWILPIGVPTAAVFLLVLRRFSPDGIRRVGSLGIDQFASVAFSVAAVFWVGLLWGAVAGMIEFDVFGLSWSGVIQLLASLALVVLTVFAPIIPGLKEDFHGRLVTLAHRNANPVRPVTERPRPDAAPAAPGQDADGQSAGEYDAAAQRTNADDPAPHVSESADGTAVTSVLVLDQELGDHQATDEVARLDLAEQVPLAAHASGGDTGTEGATADGEYVPAYSRRSRGQEPEIVSDTGSIESLLGTEARYATGDAADEVEDDDAFGGEVPPAAQPFWILAPSERDVHDERGEPLFRIGPNAWSLVIEDRGGAYVIRHDDGRIGYLHEITDITRG